MPPCPAIRRRTDALRRVAARSLPLLATLALLPGCSSSSRTPPNPLTAILRSLPASAANEPSALAFADLALAREALGNDAELPGTVSGPLAAAASPGFAEANGWDIRRASNWLELSASARPLILVVVGKFDADAVGRSLAGRGFSKRAEGVFELYVLPPSGVSSGEGSATGLFDGAAAVNEKRLVFSPDPAGLDSVAGYRGGDNSMLSLAGVQDVAVQAGRATAVRAFQPSAGCPKPRWSFTALRHLGDETLVAFALGYGDPADARFAATRIPESLPPRLPEGAGLRATDARGPQTVTSIEADATAAESLIRETVRGGRFDFLPPCP